MKHLIVKSLIIISLMYLNSFCFVNAKDKEVKIVGKNSLLEIVNNKEIEIKLIKHELMGEYIILQEYISGQLEKSQTFKIHSDQVSFDTWNDLYNKGKIVLDGQTDMYKDGMKEKSIIYKSNTEVEYISYHVNGQIKEHYGVITGMWGERLKNGDYREYDSNGTLAIIGEYRSNEKNGLFKYYNENGDEELIGKYKKDQLVDGVEVINRRNWFNYVDSYPSLITSIKDSILSKFLMLSHDSEFHMQLFVDAGGSVRTIEFPENNAIEIQQILLNKKCFTPAILKGYNVACKGWLTISNDEDGKPTVYWERFNIVDEKQLDSLPEFPGGEEALRRFIAINLRYPMEAMLKGKQGRIFISFIVTEDGEIKEVHVAKSSGNELLDNEGLRVICAMPNWKPGVIDNQPVATTFVVPVNFVLDN